MEGHANLERVSDLNVELFTGALNNAGDVHTCDILVGYNLDSHQHKLFSISFHPHSSPTELTSTRMFHILKFHRSKSNASMFSNVHLHRCIDSSLRQEHRNVSLVVSSNTLPEL